ncbi:outer membrane beta-barrel protein [Peijinzhouia sedimentorum]
MKNFSISLLLILFSFCVDATDIIGKVSDSNNELLVGASIILQPTNPSATSKGFTAISGLDGSFSFRNVPPADYILTISYIGFANYSEQIKVSDFEGDARQIVKDITLADDTEVLDEIIIIGENRGTDTQARSIERKSSNVINVVSAKQIQLSPDITVANVIQRVSGLSIERNASGDPQYAIVRGMDKRYNNTLVNGIKIPSPDNENRYVPLDIFPAVFLERLDVYKSLTANMEADAIGGTVNMIMKDAPLNEFFDADFQIGVNQMNFERGFDTYDRSKLNKLSPRELFGDSYNAKPEDFPTENMVEDRVTPLPDIFANASYGNRYLNSKLGVMVGGSFQNSYRPVSNYFYDPTVEELSSDIAGSNLLKMQELIERETSSQLQRIAFHSKLDYRLNSTNSLNFYFGKYLLNEFRVRDQTRRETFVSTTNYAVYPVTRFSNIFQDITTFDLGGEHQFSSKLNFDWNAVYSIAENDRPDDGVFSRAGTYNVESEAITGEIVYFQGSNNSRAWERNKDTDISLYFNLSYLPNIINEYTEFQIGGVARNKVRDNYYNFYNYAQIFGQFRGRDWNDFSEVKFFAMANPRGSGNNSNLVYDAAEDIYAAYINSKWNFNGTEIQVGVRAEQTFQSYEINELSASSNDIDRSQEQSYLDFFPSFSLKHPLNDKTFLKSTYFKGISRPGFYEIVPTIRSRGGGDSFYSERGNADLLPSIGHSFDLRYEYFPNSIDQILFGVFYKKIINPIEYGFPIVSGVDEEPVTNRLLPLNYDNAINFGLEADYTKYFNKFGVRFNYTYTNSQIVTDKVIIQNDSETGWNRSIITQNRPLQGQSDHIGNLSLLFKDQKNLLDAQLVINYTGERIAFVSPFYETDHYMKPMTQMDFSVEKGFNNGIVAFIKVNNILNTPYELFIKKPLAFPEDPYPYQTDPYNMANVRRDLYGTAFRLGMRYNLSN